MDINKDDLIILDKNLATFLPKEFHNPYKTLFFIWYMCSICPYHCKYCCVRYSNAEWGRVMTDDEFDSACNTINNSFVDNIGIMLLGGEPTAVPGFGKQLNRLFNIIEKNVFVDIRTNHYKNLDYYKTIYSETKTFADKISWEPTYHCYKEPEIEDFVNKTLFGPSVATLPATLAEGVLRKGKRTETNKYSTNNTETDNFINLLLSMHVFTADNALDVNTMTKGIR